MSGLVAKRDGRLQVFNRIYQQVFNHAWVEAALVELRPDYYAAAFMAWQRAAAEKNESFLLRGQALEAAEAWAKGRRLSDEDNIFLATSRKLDKLQVDRKLEAQQKANQILSEAQQKAKSTIKAGYTILTFMSIFSIALIIFSGIIFREAKNTKKYAIASKIDAYRASSEVNFNLDKKFEALIDGIKAAELSIHNLDFPVDPQKNIELISTLQQAVLWLKEKNRMEGHTGAVESVAYSPDGKFIASASWDHTIKIWRENGTLLHTLNGHSQGVRSVVFSPDGKTIASASFDKSIKIWTINGKLISTLNGHNDRVIAIPICL